MIDCNKSNFFMADDEFCKHSFIDRMSIFTLVFSLNELDSL